MPTKQKPRNLENAIKTISISKIRTDKTQSRARTDKATVHEYLLSMRAEEKFPPVVVYFDGEHYWLADGFHRLAAALEFGSETIECEVREGGMRDALKYSLGANSQLGLPRTNADKRHAVDIALRDEEWCGMSDRAIAEMCGVSNTLVSDMRLDQQVSGADTSEVSRSEMRRGRDGKLQPGSKRRSSRNALTPSLADDEPDAVAVMVRPGARNGASVVDGKERAIASELLSKVCRSMKALGLFDEFSDALTQMIRRVKGLR